MHSQSRKRALPLLVMLAAHGALLVAWLGMQRPLVPLGAEPTLFAKLIPTPTLRPVHKSAKATPFPRPMRTEAPVVAAPEAPDSSLVPDAQRVTAESALPSAADIIALAKRDIGAIDRALRGKTPPVPLERPDTPWSRFERALESAHIGSNTSVMDRYVSADGVVITRLTQGNRVRCFMSGTVNATNGILSDTSRPKPVNCPAANAGWARI